MIKNELDLENYLYNVFEFIKGNNKVATGNREKKAGFQHAVNEKRLAWGWCVCEDNEEVMDNTFKYLQIKRYDVIDVISGNPYTFRWITVKNMSFQNAEYLLHK